MQGSTPFYLGIPVCGACCWTAYASHLSSMATSPAYLSNNQCADVLNKDASLTQYPFDAVANDVSLHIVPER